MEHVDLAPLEARRIQKSFVIDGKYVVEDRLVRQQGEEGVKVLSEGRLGPRLALDHGASRKACGLAAEIQTPRTSEQAHRFHDPPQYDVVMTLPSSKRHNSALIPLPPAPSASSANARAVMVGNRSSDTTPERALRAALHARGMRFFKNRRPEPEVKCRADIVFPTERIAVFVDGCFWHRCPEHGVSPRANSDYWRAKLDRNVARDRRNDESLRAAGWDVLRVWEHDDPIRAAERVAERVLERRI